MGLGEQPDITLFDNEFEREIEKKYPLVAAALGKNSTQYNGHRQTCSHSYAFWRYSCN